jgi:hypothetical protein
MASRGEKGQKMRAIRQWRVVVTVVEDDGYTAAEARLFTDTGEDSVGAGHAQVSHDDEDVPEIGAELATARALRDLAAQLLDAAARPSPEPSSAASPAD